MDFSQLIPVFVSLNGFAVEIFAGLAVTDAIFGGVFAARHGQFDAAYLPNFLKTNLGTYYAGVVLLAIVAANQSGGDIKQAAFGVISAGGFAMSASLVKDIVVKVKNFAIKPAPKPPVAPVAVATTIAAK